jgi:outer membrane protein TolC
MVGPDFTSPSAPVADKWLEAGNTSVDTRNQEYRDWWRVFHDPVLNRLIEIAYNQNLTLVSAGTKVLEARAQLGVAVGIPADLVRRRPDIRAAELAAMAQSAQVGIAEANLYPAFSLTGTFGTAASNVGQGKPKQVFEGRGITFAFGPAFQWNILNYGQITNQVRVEDAALQGLLVDYQNIVLKAQQDVENGLASFLQGRKEVDLLRESVAAASAALGLAFCNTIWAPGISRLC